MANRGRRKLKKKEYFRQIFLPALGMEGNEIIYLSASTKEKLDKLEKKYTKDNRGWRI